MRKSDAHPERGHKGDLKVTCPNFPESPANTAPAGRSAVTIHGLFFEQGSFTFSPLLHFPCSPGAHSNSSLVNPPPLTGPHAHHQDSERITSDISSNAEFQSNQSTNAPLSAAKASLFGVPGRWGPRGENRFVSSVIFVSLGIPFSLPPLRPLFPVTLSSGQLHLSSNTDSRREPFVTSHPGPAPPRGGLY